MKIILDIIFACVRDTIKSAEVKFSEKFKLFNVKDTCAQTNAALTKPGHVVGE